VSADDRTSNLFINYYSNHQFDYQSTGYDGSESLIVFDIENQETLSPEALKIVKDAQKLDIPCIGLSQLNNQNQRHYYQEQGIHHIITKPFHIDRLERSLNKLTPTLATICNGNNQGKLKVLLAENDRVSQILFSRCLEAKDCIVQIAKNGMEAWNMFQQDSYDLIIVDLQMPEKNGLQLARDIRQINSEVPILGCSASVLENTRRSCLTAGMNDFISKPFIKSHLLKTVYDLTGFGSETIYDRYRILHIDDEEDILEIVADTLQTCLPGIKIKSSSNAIDACTLLGSFQPHIILTDMQMPQMDGLNFVRYIKSDSLYRDTVVTVLTGLSDQNIAVKQIQKHGVAKVFFKPYKAIELVTHFKSILDSIY
ncbi:response regulator, partial [bacterium]|nr:response regulator [bacterium]